MPTWNEMQRKAIYTHDKNILVSASAGSGKTTVLIARLIDLIQNKKIEITQILAMTFTEAAANEMKKRLSLELNKALSNTEDKDEKLHLEKQLANLGSSYISTIHGFCLNIIQNYYYTISLNKERVNNIMDESTQIKLLNESMQMMMNEYIKDDEFKKLCITFSDRSNDYTILKESILQLFNLASSKTNPIQFLQSCKCEYKIKKLSDYHKNILTSFFNYLTIQCQSIYDSCEHIRQYAIENEDQKAFEKIEKKMKVLKDCLKYLRIQGYTLFKEHFTLNSTFSIPTIKNVDECKIIKRECESIESSLFNILFSEKDFISFSNENQTSINILVDATITLYNNYEKLKEEENAIDFSDMEHYAIAILEANNHLVASIYKDKFYEIMVDEFQDSNDVQDYLVRLICKNNNVFRVGDIKQSIYGFRHASPAIMQSLIKNQGMNDEVIYLNNNYRSKKSIVDFNNELFKKLMNVSGFNSSFTKDDYAYCGLDSQAENNHPAVFHLLDYDEMETTLSKDELKADYIANQILKKIDEGYQFKDFVVLVKTNIKSDALRVAFENYNIPYFINTKHGFYDSSAIQNVISLLKALHNPHDDISFSATMLSPFGKFSDHDFADAVLKKEKQQSFFSYFSDHYDLSFFHELLQMSKKVKLSDILIKIYSLNNYYETYTTLQEKSNLDKLFEVVNQLEKDSFLSISAFLDYLSLSKDAQIGEAIPISNNENVVRVMSIHQSKGLQFPIVFLYSINSVNIHDTGGPIAFDDELKIGFKYFSVDNRLSYPTIEKIAIDHKITKNALEEEMRLLYVATTRAQNELYIIDTLNKNPLYPINTIEIYKKKGFTSWILQTYEHSNKYNLFNKLIISNYEIQPSISKQRTIKKNISHYTHSINEITNMAPSENEIISFTPKPFSLHENYAMNRGSNLHKIVELAPHKKWDESLLLDIAKSNNISLDKTALSQLINLCNNPIFSSTFNADEIYPEFSFIVKKNNNIIHGFMDYVAIFNKEIILIDFKSDANIDEQELIQRYHGQIEAYKESLFILYPEYNIKSYIYSFFLNKEIEL